MVCGQFYCAKFELNNLNILAKQIIFNDATAIHTKSNQYGHTLEQIISIKGVNGRIIDVVFVWLKSSADGVVRLITAIPTKK